MNFYEEMLIDELCEISGFKYEDISKIEKYPLEISHKVLSVLIQTACESQNDVSIILGRTKISEIDKSWLLNHLVEVATTCLNLDDDWEYRRLLELVAEAVPELKQEVIEIGLNSTNDDIKEAANDFL